MKLSRGHLYRRSDRSVCNLSHRYIQDRFLPDKAIDLLDEAGAKVNLKATGANKEKWQERLRQIEIEKTKALKEEHYELAAKLRDEEMRN